MAPHTSVELVVIKKRKYTTLRRLTRSVAPTEVGAGWLSVVLSHFNKDDDGDDDVRLIVAKGRRGEAMGFVAYRVVAGRTRGDAGHLAYVYLLHVVRRARGGGVGRALVDAVFREEPGRSVVAQATRQSEAFWSRMQRFIALDGRGDDAFLRRALLAACSADDCLHPANAGLRAFVGLP